MKKILVVAAHPDDEILGCGGTIARYAQEGAEIHSLILGEEVTSRTTVSKKSSHLALENLKKQALTANKIIGVKKVYFSSLADNRFDTVPLLEIIKEIEKVKNDFKPEIIFTHYRSDLNIDHQITYQAVLTATRPLPEEFVKTILAFEVASSTEWNYPLSFSPNVFYDITKTIDLKIKALAAYHSEMREFPHPRSLPGIKLQAQNRGLQSGVTDAEAFMLVRNIV
jgi:LmbE family N-acetylglucosaminyl deacetylase